jgi:hypothetical protein
MYNITLFIPDYGRNVEPMDSCFSFLKVFSGCWPLGLSIFFNKWDRGEYPDQNLLIPTGCPSYKQTGSKKGNHIACATAEIWLESRISPKEPASLWRKDRLFIGRCFP